MSTSRQRRAERRAAQRGRREQILERFGEAADERTAGDRRQPRTPDETAAILRRLGIEDRRRQDRRRR